MMSLKIIFNQICENLENVNDTSQNFSNLNTDEERFSFTYYLCRKYIQNFHFETTNKCSDKSEKARKTGNEKFGKNFFWEALAIYNESVALAPNKSSELSFAYGNRAACLIKLNFFKEALEDIDRALCLPVTNDFRNKLLLRKDKCLSLINNNHETSSFMIGTGQIPALSRAESSFFDSASNLVELSYDKYWERQLVAHDDISTGDVLVVEKPFSSVLLPDHIYTHCTHCFKRCFNPVPCNNCSVAVFCNSECLNSAQNRYHKTECSILSTLFKLKASRMELLALRILIDASKQGENLEKLLTETTEGNFSQNKNIENCKFYKSQDFKNIYSLITNSDKRSASDLFYRSVISTISIFLLEKYTNFFACTGSEGKDSLKLFSGSLVLRFMQSLPCNAHEISEFCEDGLNEIGAGAYATLSLINHSCDPNVVRHSCQDVVVLRAIRPIKRGEQILDNYGYHYATHLLSERQNALMKQYYFRCQCEACKCLWSVYEDLPEKPLKIKKQINMEVYTKLTENFEKNLDNVFKGDFNFDVISEFKTYLDFLDEFVERPWKPYNKCQEALKHCLSFFGNHFKFSKGVIPS